MNNKVFGKEYVLISNRCHFNKNGKCREPQGGITCNIDECPFIERTEKYWGK